MNDLVDFGQSFIFNYMNLTPSIHALLWSQSNILVHDYSPFERTIHVWNNLSLETVSQQHQLFLNTCKKNYAPYVIT